MSSLETIIFGILTVFLVVRLWSVLGQRDEDDSNRSTPSHPFSRPPHEDNGVVILPPRKAEASPMGADITIHGYAAASLAGGLDSIKCLDPSFDEKTFLAGAKAAFESIVTAFAEGNLSPVERLLADEVKTSFGMAIEARRLAGQKLESKIDRIRDIEIEAAKAEGATAIITVRFVSAQSNIVRGSDNAILSGDPGKTEEIQDLWVFARDTSQGDPNWQLVETRN